MTQKRTAKSFGGYCVLSANLILLLNTKDGLGMFGETGFIGNVWIAQNVLPTAGMKHIMHAHDHDHASLLVSGSASVKIGNEPAKIFKAPTFIMVKATFSHEFTALEDNTVWYCVFALRDLDGNVMTQVNPENVPSLDLISTSMRGEMHYRSMYNDAVEEISTLNRTIENLKNRIRLLRSGLIVANALSDGSAEDIMNEPEMS